MTKFDTNKVKRSKEVRTSYTYEWATYIPGRRPQFKVHGLKGQAIAALKYRAVGERYPSKVTRLPPDQQLFFRKLGTELWEEIALVEEYMDEPRACIIKGELK